MSKSTITTLAGNGKSKTSQNQQKNDKPFVIIKGEKIHYKPLNANAFLEYENRKSKQNIKLANEWLIGEAYGYDFDFRQYRFRDRGRLLIGLTYADVLCLDNQPLTESSYFEVEGNKFREKSDSGDAFDTFAVQQQKGDPLAYLNVAKRGLLINDEAIEDHHFELTANQGGIGFKGMAAIQRWALAFLSSN